MLTRREFLEGATALVGIGLFGGCGESVYGVRVDPSDSGRSVYQATARYYSLGVERRVWQNPQLSNLRKVISVDGVVSERWVFEINDRRYDGSADAAELTEVRAGDIITWRTI